MSEHSLPPVINKVLTKIDQQHTANSQRQDAVSQHADSLAEGHTVRGDQPTVGANYDNTDHQLMYDMINQHIDPGAVGESGQAISKAGKALSALQQQGASALNTSAADWQGESGDQARAFTAQLVEYLRQTGSGMHLVGTQMSNQAEAAALAKNSMPKPVPYDPTALNKQLQSAHNPVAMATQHQQDMALHEKSVNAQQRAAHVMNTYDYTLDKSTKLPAFYAPPRAPSTQQHSAALRAPGELDAASYHGGSDAGVPLPLGGLGMNNGGTASGGGTSGPEAGVNGFGVPGGLGAGQRSAAGVGARGAGGESDGGARGISAAENAESRGGAGARGMGVPAGRGKKKESEEDRYAPTYLVEPDPDEVFGCDIKTAPPVIGG